MYVWTILSELVCCWCLRNNKTFLHFLVFEFAFSNHSSTKIVKTELLRYGQYWACRAVVILINATTLMHKSTLNTNNFGNNHLDKSTRNKIFLKFFGDYNGVCLKNLQRIEQKLENAFWPNFPFFWQFCNFKKLIIGILFHQQMPLIFLRQVISSVGGEIFKNYSKIHLESIKFEKQCIKIGC